MCRDGFRGTCPSCGGETTCREAAAFMCGACEDGAYEETPTPTDDPHREAGERQGSRRSDQSPAGSDSVGVGPRPSKCWCEGCSKLGWVVVRLPEPLYRLANRLREWLR